MILICNIYFGLGLVCIVYSNILCLVVLEIPSCISSNKSVKTKDKKKSQADTSFAHQSKFSKLSSSFDHDLSYCFHLNSTLILSRPSNLSTYRTISTFSHVCMSFGDLAFNFFPFFSHYNLTVHKLISFSLI